MIRFGGCAFKQIKVGSGAIVRTDRISADISS